MTTENSGSRIIVALDMRNLDKVLSHVKALGTSVGGYKVRGSLLRRETTRKVVKAMSDFGATVFADAKLNDTPKSMSEDAGELFEDGVKVVTVMAASTLDGMKAAVDAKKPDCKVLAVTVLTSMNDDECQNTYGRTASAEVLKFARNAVLAGVDGIVCSPQEAAALRKRFELHKLEIWTPGVRPQWAAPAGQVRFTTPAQAIVAGATRLIIGDPIINPPAEIGTSVQAVTSIRNEITNALMQNALGSGGMPS